MLRYGEVAMSSFQLEFFAIFFSSSKRFQRDMKMSLGGMAVLSQMEFQSTEKLAGFIEWPAHFTFTHSFFIMHSILIKLQEITSSTVVSVIRMQLCVCVL
jgi:hypothetical protein